LWNSVNASLGEHSPSDFELGAQIQTEQLFNMDFSFPLDVGFESELNVAFGYQHHFEQFEIIAGEEASYQTGPFTDNGEAIGANGFPGFSPKTAGTNSCSAQLNQDTFLKELCSYSTGDRSPLAV
jgi:iron complex outermembrane receptor protein